VSANQPAVLSGTTRQREAGGHVVDINALQETLILIKPDALERGQAGEVIQRFEKAGLRIKRIRSITPALAKVEQHYADLKTRNPRAFDRNTRYLAGKHLIAFVLAGVNAIAKARMLIGSTEPASAQPGTIRGDLSSDTIPLADSEDRGLYNLVHASDSVESARREVEVWFD
jgi:nucleoside-diphosphate kinase